VICAEKTKPLFQANLQPEFKFLIEAYQDFPLSVQHEKEQAKNFPPGVPSVSGHLTASSQDNVTFSSLI